MLFLKLQIWCIWHLMSLNDGHRDLVKRILILWKMSYSCILDYYAGMEKRDCSSQFNGHLWRWTKYHILGAINLAHSLFSRSFTLDHTT